MNEGNSEINFGRLEERVDNVLKAVEKLAERFDKLEGRYATIEQHVKLEKSVDVLTARLWGAVMIIIAGFLNSIFEVIKLK